MTAFTRLVPFYYTDQQPILLEARSSKFLIFVSLTIATFTDLFLYGVIVPVVPFALESRVGIVQDDVQHWVSVLVAIYGVFLFVGCPLYGLLSDVMSTRRWPYLFGLVVLAGATGLLCAGTNLGLWISGRALQGLAAAIVATIGTALLVDTVPKSELGHYIGYLGAAQSLGILFGPLLGGIVYNQGGYYAVFAMCFAVIAVDIVLRLVMIEKQVARRWLRDEQLGTQDVAPSPCIADEENADLDKQTAPAFTTGQNDTINDKIGHPEYESKKEQDQERVTPQAKRTRVPPVLSLLKSRRLLAALYGSVVQAILFTAFDSTLPIFVQNVFQWDSLGAGLIFLPIALPSFLSPLVGYLTDKVGPRWFATSGFLIAVVPLVCLRFVTHNTIGQKVLLCALLVLAGTSIAMTLPSLAAEISYIVEEKDAQQPGIFGKHGAYGQAYGLFWMAFALGCLIGPIWGGFVQQTAGWGTMVWTIALLSGTTALPTVLWTGGWIFDKADFLQGREAAGRRALEQRGYA